MRFFSYYIREIFLKHRNSEVRWIYTFSIFYLLNFPNRDHHHHVANITVKLKISNSEKRRWKIYMWRETNFRVFECFFSDFGFCQVREREMFNWKIDVKMQNDVKYRQRLLFNLTNFAVFCRNCRLAGIITPLLYVCFSLSAWLLWCRTIDMVDNRKLLKQIPSISRAICATLRLRWIFMNIDRMLIKSD